MALTVEDGTGVDGANSYVTLVEVRAYASARGLTIPAVDADLEKLVVKSTDYLEAQRRRYVGLRVNGQGYLQWPRMQDDGSGVVIDGCELTTTEVPSELKLAQCQLVAELVDVDPLGTVSGAAIRREKIDVLETEYAVSDGNRAPAPFMPKVEALLAPLFKASGFGGLSTVRV